jgi:hypothetical protein
MNWKSDEGAITAEYAIATMAAVAFAGLLVMVLRSEEVRGLIFDVVASALSF